MPPRLILNADDFGLTSGINRAIGQLHQAGVLTSATLMATGRAFDDAVAVARANPTLGVGCHITLVDAVPAAPPEAIPSLLSSDGKTLRASIIDFTQALLRGEIRGDDITREALAQIQKLQRAGIDITHLDTHKHTHLFPAVARPLLHLAERTSITAIRNPFEPDYLRSLGHGGLMRRLQIRLLNMQEPAFMRLPQIQNKQVLTTNGTIGISATGDLNNKTLTETLNALPSEGTFELCCHPGYNDRELDSVVTRLRISRDIEREALLSVIPQLTSQPNAPQLMHYGDLGTIRETGRFEPNAGHEKVL
jgi:chitin disaccharide deacetylase